MNEAEEIQHLRKLVWNVRSARARLRVDDPVRRAHVLRLEKFMKKVEARKVVPQPVTQTGTEAAQPYVSKYYRRMARLATAAVGCLVVLVGCSVSESHKKNQAGVRYSDIPGEESGLQSHKSLPPLPGEVSSFKFQASSALPVRQRWLVWDGNAMEYLVETGPQRGTITNSFRVATNAVLFKSGVHYRVSAIGPDGLVGGALWPSNRIAELRLKDANGGNVLLMRFTNNPPGGSRFWTVTNNPSAFIADITTGWQ